MEDHIERWNRCLQLIKEHLPKDTGLIPADDAEWVYQNWFAPVTCDRFDPDTGALLLSVPDEHVCEYIEHYRMRLWSWALRTAFCQNVRLSYRIRTAAQKPDGHLAGAAYHERLHFTIPDARKRLEEELRRAVGPGFQWLQRPYDKIVSWLSDNKGRGLLFVGPSGVGKSVMCCDILPAIIGGKDKDKIPVVTAEQMLTRGDELKRAEVVVIDGLGREPRKKYGHQDNTFLDLCEASVNGGPLLIVNTSLSTNTVNSALFPDSIERLYGIEVLDRLKVIATTAVSYDRSLRPSQ